MVSRVFERELKGAFGKLQWCFRKFQRSFKEVSRLFKKVLRLFQDYFKAASRKIEGHFEEDFSEFI